MLGEYPFGLNLDLNQPPQRSAVLASLGPIALADRAQQQRTAAGHLGLVGLNETVGGL
jgi:hypothetical protein